MKDQTVTLNNKKRNDKTYKFRIEDNVIIGEEVAVPRVPVNVAGEALMILKSKPDFIGQVDAFTGKVNTYADMSERSIKCALWLKKQGVKPGDIIGLCTDNNLDAPIIMLGIMYIGAICNTWDHELSLITARHFISFTSPKIIFTITSSATSLTEASKELKTNTRIVTLNKLDGYESFEEDVLKGHDTRAVVEFECTTMNPSDVALLVPSSGTTGMPKGTEISHFSLYSCMQPVKIADIAGDICIFTPTLRWHYGVLMAFKVIMGCATKIVVPDNDDVEAMCQFIDKYRVTFFATDPFMLIKLLKNNLTEKYRLSSLRLIFSSGAHFKKEHYLALKKKLPNVVISNNYGMTDTACGCCAQSETSKPGSVGFVGYSVRLKIVDVETEKTLGPNEIGEIRLKALSMMNGYYNNPEATKQAFDSDGWFLTGDLGYYDEDGEVFIVDRISDFINFRSINVSPGEIEEILSVHPAIFEAAVIGISDEVDEQHPMAIVARVPNQTVTEEEIINLVENNMPDHCRLRAGVKFIDKLPRTNTGKIARRQLRGMFVK